MTITKNREGYWVIGDFINGYWVSKMYLYYTKKEAIKKFKEEATIIKVGFNK